MKEKCDQLGHAWVTTTAPGWFRCDRVIDLKLVKRNTQYKPVVCGALAQCPWCLGFRDTTYEMVLCVNHASLDITSLPLVSHHKERVYHASHGKQQSLW